MKNEIRLIKFIKIVVTIALLAAIITTIVMAVKGAIHLIVPIAIGLLAIPSFLMMQTLQNTMSRVEALTIALCKKDLVKESTVENIQDNIDTYIKKQIEKESEQEQEHLLKCTNCYYILDENGYCENCGASINEYTNLNQNTK
jgi:hypothetical protein